MFNYSGWSNGDPRAGEGATTLVITSEDNTIEQNSQSFDVVTKTLTTDLSAKVGQELSPTFITIDTTILANDYKTVKYIFEANSLTLFAPEAPVTGASYTFINGNYSSNIISGNGKTINGNATIALDPYQAGALYYDGANFELLTPATVSWGKIIGTLSNQTDLQNTLNSKQSLVSSPTNNNIVTMNNLGQGINSGVSITTSPSFNNNTTTPTTAAMQAAIASAIIAQQYPQGGYDASTNLFPSTSAVGEAITANDFWYITTAGNLGGTPVYKGNLLVALVDNPGQTATNWIIIQSTVFSVFGRQGVIVAMAGDYTFAQITGLPTTAPAGKIMQGNGTGWQVADISAGNGITITNVSGTITITISVPVSIANGGTNNNTIGDAGTLAQSNGLSLVYTTAKYPADATGAGKILRSNGTDYVKSTATYPDTASTSDYVLTSDGTNFISKSPSVKSYGVFVPFLANKIISGTDWISNSLGSDIGKSMAASNGTTFTYHYFVYLKVSVTYRFSCSFFKFNNAGIIQFSLKSIDLGTTYNTLTNLDLYSATQGVVALNKDSFTFSPAGFSAGDWVPCVLDFSCSTKNASSTGFYVVSNDGNTGFSFYERVS